MKEIKNLKLDEERALYGITDVQVIKCSFDGEKDGESALKECSNINIEDCYFNLRYPMWHINKLRLIDSNITKNARAAIWYSDNIYINNTKLHGIKALRECKNINISKCDIVSEEFGWKSSNIRIDDATVNSEYAFLESNNISINNLKFSGKYSFQYVENLFIKDSYLDTKDAFWHAKNVVIQDSTIKGEYLGWYAENIKFINCKIIGTQPLCYTKGVELENCTTVGCDLSFENSTVNGTIIGNIDSIKNLTSGTVIVDTIGEIIKNEKFKGQIIINKKEVA